MTLPHLSLRHVPMATLLLALLFGTGLARAADGDSDELTQQCRTYQTSYDRTYCVAKLFLASDDELNEVYKKLRAQLDADTRQSLLEVQRGWIGYRDGACSDDGTIDVACNYGLNRDRSNYLRDRLRECQTGSCNTRLIGRQSW